MHALLCWHLQHIANELQVRAMCSRDFLYRDWCQLNDCLPAVFAGLLQHPRCVNLRLHGVYLPTRDARKRDFCVRIAITRVSRERERANNCGELVGLDQWYRL